MKKTFGIELELGLVKAGLEKPFEKDFFRSFRAFKRYKKDRISMRTGFFGRIDKKDKECLFGIRLIEEASKREKEFLQKEYEKLAIVDEAELVKKIMELGRDMEKNMFLLKKKWNLAKSVIPALFKINKTFSEFEYLLKKKILLEIAFFRTLPFYFSLVRKLPKAMQASLKYDESDAIEFVSKPSFNLEAIEKELLRNILAAEKALGKSGLTLFFGSTYPRTQRIGLFKQIGIGEDHNLLGLHLHIGNFESLEEMAGCYNKIIRFFEKKPEIIDETRREYYYLRNPGKLDLQKDLDCQIEKLFGKNSKLEKAGRPDIDAIISVLNRKKTKHIARDYATVFIRPELCTIEIRAFGTKGNGIKNPKESLHKNISFLKKFLEEVEAER